ncbi:unnamed protein product [Psylliodes chrysocephalus]|uniref:Uncharacterized protein n=1 Tax=Psylliodes chrysocephalus TaxID=3402493 RepID=A0A9P0D7N5_9CUCU|nr:unnamed protein product [Psylliodes chrysocephala]
MNNIGFFVFSSLVLSAAVVVKGKDSECECEDILNKILQKLYANSGEIQKTINELEKDLKKINNQADENTEKLCKIENQIEKLNIEQNAILNIVNSHTTGLDNIDNSIQKIIKNEEHLEQVLEGNSCLMDELKRILLEVRDCVCKDDTTSSSTTTETTTYKDITPTTSTTETTTFTETTTLDTDSYT